ncbi:MAG TPA: hypothetical protein VL523_12740 [Terriglobia bacterium]|nr:hypothetical protein [Terriglobia bacterium]
MKPAALVRAQVEAALGPGSPSPFAQCEAHPPELVATGIAAVDALTGGLPRASLTEVSGPPSSGRTALELALVASLTVKGESCALIDAEDSFDPASALAAGVALERLLWVRCGGLEQALHATDLLLGAGGFGAVVLDLAGIPARRARRVPPSYWFRFRRAVENTSTVLALIGEEPCAQSAASLVLYLENEDVGWSVVDESRRSKAESRKLKLSLSNSPPHVRLLRGIRWRAEVLRNRNTPPELLKMEGCRLPRASKLEIRNSKLVAAHDVQKRTRNDGESNFDFQISSFELQASISNLP